MSVHLLGICGSLRKSSTNLGLLRAAEKSLPDGVTMTIAQLDDVAFYNSDLAEKPPAVKRVLEQIERADGFLLASPEYNYSIAPALKNIIDWASREPDNRLLNGKTAAILGSGGGMGTSRSQYHLRQVCVCLNLHVLNKPEVFANSFVGHFNEAGDLIDEATQKMVAAQLQALVQWTRRMKG
jgi:chromate reductase, NAD(P)H dehydrogenase (quinone)